MLPTDDCDIDDTVGKNTEGDCDTLAREASKEFKIKRNYLDQWCNLTLTRWFWGTKVCLQVSKISKICQFGCLTGQATTWKADFENFSRYSLIKWYQFLSI